MKKILVFMLVMSFLFTGCGVSNTVNNKQESAIDKAETTIKSYFDSFQKGNFEDMKQYCTASFIRKYFHEKDVNGSKSEKMIKIEKKVNENNAYKLTVRYRCVPVENSALYDANKEKVESTITYELINQNGKMKINNCYTGN